MLVARQAVPLQPNAPSCGSQPAHISLTARRQRHAHQHRDNKARGARPNHRDGRLNLPLDRKSLHIRCLQQAPSTPRHVRHRWRSSPAMLHVQCSSESRLSTSGFQGAAHRRPGGSRSRGAAYRPDRRTEERLFAVTPRGVEGVGSVEWRKAPPGAYMREAAAAFGRRRPPGALRGWSGLPGHRGSGRPGCRSLTRARRAGRARIR